ncbi:hypothetical protein MA16_Dca012897 [Dendrobium catenatum]|uniref:Uncharacterized protein n=1 Tax=Dendrobium catenatum TaxID=906689 RepID=A0A2I0W1M1_9ASPA|nr:hypothetical protein MA16_Dca012897 [Dendrobium catenatum]
MNLVLDDADEHNIKKNTIKPLGDSYLHFSFVFPLLSSASHKSLSELRARKW